MLLCNTVKNVTVSVPDEVYRAARVTAAQRGSTVSALVAGFLSSLSERDAQFERLQADQRRVQAGIGRFSACDRLGREELHGRAVR